MLPFHAKLQVTLSLVALVLTIWGAVNALRGRCGETYIAGLWIAELLLISQALIGATIFFAMGAPLFMAMHIVYGVIAPLFIPAAILLARGQRGRREATSFAVAAFLVLVIIMRAYETGGGG